MIPVALALVHFIWQGAALAALAAILQRLSTRATTRYTIGVVTLAAMTVCVVSTAVWLAPASTPLVVVDDASHGENGSSAAFVSPVVVSGVSRTVAPAAPSATTVFSAVTAPAIALLSRPAIACVIVVAWLIGVLALTLRLTGAWVVTRRWAARAVEPLGTELSARVRRLVSLLDLKSTVRILESADVAAPTIVGWLRPVILMPAAALTGLSVAQVDALIAHELSHLKRHDPIVNVLQSVVETLLFYHPGVWWVSRGVRQAREECCDDRAIAACSAEAELAHRCLSTCPWASTSSR